MAHIGKIILGGLAAAAAVSPAAALNVPVTSYDMINGRSGSYTYHDDTYNGSGNPNVDSSMLSGGVGQVTDGVLATGHWYDSPQPYVGWDTISPTITFHFAGPTYLAGASFYFDNAGGAGGVFLPTDIEFDTGSGFQSFAPTISFLGPILARYSYDLGNVSASTISARINHPVNSTYIMLTDASFSEGVAPGPVPEASTWAMMLGGFGMLGTAMRRRRVNQGISHA